MATSKDPEGKRQSLKEKMEEEGEEEEEEEEEDEGEEEEEELGFGENEKKKKMRASREGSSTSPPSCQADNCDADLREARPYHRRHKVCEFHAKSPLVTVVGLDQRFCQQCSRFHSISEFDETKKSCRKRLAGHNERRRKNLIS